ATSQRAEMGAQDAVKQSLQRGQSIVDVALAAGETVVDALTELKSLAVAIQDAPATGDTQTKLHADFTAITNEITAALGGATFDGVNLFKANAAAVEVTTNTGATGNKFTLKAIAAADTNPLAGGAGAGAYNLATPDKANRTAANVDSAISAFTTVLADFGTKSKSLDRQMTFVGKMQDSLETGVGNLVDADLAKESARLTALQTKQQLGVQALSIANSSSSMLLGLFR
ncbi:flagellin, partial [Brevundimonas sp.]|uniref:flagellin n=1 Tax=Brevundimonas sp. TaxID=1871086 RepID=UPI002FC8EB42